MVESRAETASLSDKTEFTETQDQSRTHHGSTLGTDPSGKAAQREGLKTVFGGTDAQEGAKMLQESLDAMWPGGTPAHGGELPGQPSMTPPGNSQNRQQNPGAPYQNRMFGDPVGGEYGGAAYAPQYTPQPFSGFNMGQPVGYMQMGGTPGYPPGQVPYAPDMMGTPVQNSGYGMQSQQQYWTPQGPVTFQMAQCNMTKQMLLDQCVQMGILQYNGQQHQNQQQGQQQDQHQQYNTADRRSRQSSVGPKPIFAWKQDEEEERKDRNVDVSRVKVTPISVSTASKAQNSQYLFMGQLEELNVPTTGGTSEQSKQLKQLVDKWCCESEPIITSLRNTFESGGSGAERLEHVVASFIMPMQQQRDVDPEGAVARYDYSKLMAGTGTDFHSELLNFKEKVARLPRGVRADPAYWINRIKEKTSDGQLAAFEREVKSEEKSGNGGVQHDADHEWITFSRVMSKAIDTQRKRNAKSAAEQQMTPYGLAAHGLGAGGRQQQGGRPTACDLCDGFKCPHESDANSPCDVYAFSVSQHRAKEIIDDPPLKAFVDRNRKRYGKAPINYPQPTEQQKQKMEQYDAHRETLFATKGKGGKGGSAQAGRPPAANAHSEQSTYEQQLDEGLERLEKLREQFGM